MHYHIEFLLIQITQALELTYILRCVRQALTGPRNAKKKRRESDDQRRNRAKTC